jgi:putative Ca2+/H+ antiporter (TMEM165/GDT1 family)
LLLAAGFLLLADQETSSQRPEACKKLNWTKIYHTTFVTFLGDMTLVSVIKLSGMKLGGTAEIVFNKKRPDFQPI